MKVVILAGGLGTRLAEETSVLPKPMVEIGGRPILWHIMKYYAHHGFKDFLVALGYKGEVIKRYFLEYYHLNGNFMIELSTGSVQRNDRQTDDWVVQLIDTGSNTLTGGRVKRLNEYIGSETFMVTYGDGLSDVDLRELLSFHRSHGRIATVTAVRPPARFGGIMFDGDMVKEFTEKPQIGEGWINGGFLIFEREVFEYIDGDGSSLEKDVLEKLAKDKQLAAYRHDGFWQCMDTLRDLRLLEQWWQGEKPPWRLWT